MKKLYVLLFAMLLTVGAFGQSYPEVSIMDIQYIEQSKLDTATYHDLPPANLGDTVVVTGVVMMPPYVDADPLNDPLYYVGGGAAGFYMVDTAQMRWGGVLLRNAAPASPYTTLDSGMVIKITCEITEYYTTTQLNVISFEASGVLDQVTRPEPVVLTLDSLNQTGTSDRQPFSEKWEGAYVEIRDVTTTGRSGAEFQVFDENGTTLNVGDNSNYFFGTQGPVDGSSLNYIRGFIETRSDIGLVIHPIYPDDYEVAVTPASISNVTRDKATVLLTESVAVNAMVTDDQGVDSVYLWYEVDGGGFTKVVMDTTTADSLFTATIPGQDSSFVNYFIEAVDAGGNRSTSPSDTSESRYSYFVLDRSTLRVQEVQYSPWGSGYSPYHGYSVSVRGVVTADSSDIGSQMYMQSGTGPWSGIWIFGDNVLGYSRGDEITVTGTVGENFDVTRLSTSGNVTLHGSGVTVPAPEVLSTLVIDEKSAGDLEAEPWEGVLIQYNNITITDENADGEAGPDGSNYGEMFVADTSNVRTRVELQDGMHDYHNYWSSDLEFEPVRLFTTDEFSSLTGILYYSFGNYKLIPRTNDDFVGYVSSADEKESAMPEKFELSQNYPNPFNPSTVIEYALPMAGQVKLSVYNILGQEIAVLVNNHQKAGTHNVTFNASELPSGVYIYSISAGNFNATKKMILIK